MVTETKLQLEAKIRNLRSKRDKMQTDVWKDKKYHALTQQQDALEKKLKVIEEAEEEEKRKQEKKEDNKNRKTFTLIVQSVVAIGGMMLNSLPLVVFASTMILSDAISDLKRKGD